MRAYVIDRPGGPEVLRLREVPDPTPQAGEVLIAIHAFGLNRAEVVTRRGGSGAAVQFPRIIGIECVGEVVTAPRGELAPGQRVAALMGGMGRAYDGSYAEQVVVPATQVIPLSTRLPWAQLAALPETYLTAWGCVHEALRATEGARVVIRPAASALGRAVVQLVAELGGEVIGVTRSAPKVPALLDAGFADVLVSADAVADQVRHRWPRGATGVIDTVTSAATVRDDLAMRAKGGRVCIAGSLWASAGAGSPGPLVAAALALPYVSMYSSEKVSAARHTDLLQRIVARVEEGNYRAEPSTVIAFEDLADAHAEMDANAHAGKVVVVHHPPLPQDRDVP